MRKSRKDRCCQRYARLLHMHTRLPPQPGGVSDKQRWETAFVEAVSPTREDISPPYGCAAGAAAAPHVQ